MSTDAESEEDSGFGSELEYSMEEDSEMDMDESNDYAFDPAEDIDVSSRRAPYEVLTEQQLRERRAQAMQAVTSVTGISDDEASRVLRHYKWDPDRVHEEYFSNITGVREKLGLKQVDTEIGAAAASAAAQGTPARKGKTRAKKALCAICYDEFPADSMLAGPCGHGYCKDCWHSYAATAIADGPACLDLRCPDPDCHVAVPAEVLSEVLSSDEEAKVDRYALRSFVEDNRRVSWCPAPGCVFAVQSIREVSRDPLDITCKCGSTFCFNCKEEAHRPVDCATVSKWLLKNSAESENLNWIMANTKPCPKCKRPIEKNHGCMHMACSQCKHEFCWLCLGDWKTHNDATGGFYACNRYEQGKKEGKYNEEEAKRERAKQSLERYMHYYQRFAENDRARKQAIAKMTDFAEKKIEELSEKTATPTSQLKMVLDAWAQVIDCRRILKWTYAFGYYTFTQEEEPTASGSNVSPPLSKEQQSFFEFSQGQAESYLEKLHKMVEQDLGEMLGEEEDSSAALTGWPRFKEALIGLTDVTQSHFSKLVNELERGMASLLDTYRTEEAEGAASADAGSAEAPSAAKKGRTWKHSRRSRRGRGAADDSAGGSDAPRKFMDDAATAEAVAGYWSCTACTFANDLGNNFCEMCETARAR